MVDNVNGNASSTGLSARVNAPRQAPMPAVGGDLTWRAASNADIPKILQLVNAANKLDDPARVLVADDVNGPFTGSDAQPNSNTVIALDPTGQAVAYAAASPPEIQKLAAVVEGSGVVHPQRRGQGIGTALLNWQDARARQMLANQSEDLPGWLGTIAPESAPATRALLEKNGFAEKRCWLEMQRDLSDEIPDPAVPSNIQITTPENLSEETRLAYNDSFQSHWGSAPDTPESWRNREQRADYRPDLSFVAVAESPEGAPEVTGLVISRVSPEKWEARGGSFAYIHLMGVRSSWRGKGIATALLVHSMQAFRSAGLERAELNVDADSPTGAVSVYENLGFRAAYRHSTYVKEY